MRGLYFPLLILVVLVTTGRAAIRIETDRLSGSDVPLPFAVDVLSDDLINSGQTSLSGVNAYPTAPGAGEEFSASNLNDGDYLEGDSNITYFEPSQLPATITFNLDLTSNTTG